MRNIIKNNKKNIKNLMRYTLCHNLCFDRGIFMIYLVYKGLSVSEVALWQSVLNMSMVVGEIPTGMIADKIGKKRALMIGNVMVITYYALMFVSQSFWGFIIGAIMFGVGSTFVSGSDQAFLYDLLDGGESVEYLGKMSAVATVAIGVATVVGGYMQLISWEIVIISSAVAMCIGMIFLSLLPNIVHKSDKVPINKLCKQLKSNKTIVCIMAVAGVNVGVFSVLRLYMQRILSEYGVLTQSISIMYIVESVLATIILANVSKIQKKFGILKSVSSAAIISCVVYLSLVFGGVLTLVIGLLVIDMVTSYVDTIIVDTFSNAIDDDVRATGLSVLNMISAFIMSCMFYIISKINNYDVVFITCAGIVGSLLTFIVVRKIITVEYD